MESNPLCAICIIDIRTSQLPLIEYSPTTLAQCRGNYKTGWNLTMPYMRFSIRSGPLGLNLNLMKCSQIIIDLYNNPTFLLSLAKEAFQHQRLVVDLL